MVFPDFGKCTGKREIPPNCTLIPPPGIGITSKVGISCSSPIPPKVIPIVSQVNKSLIILIHKGVNQSVTNVAAMRPPSFPHWG